MKPKDQNIRFLTFDEIKHLIGSIAGSDFRAQRDRAMVETLFSTGLRIAELLALKREDITFDRPTLELSIVGKGGYRRTVYFHPSALRAIGEYLKGREDKDCRLFPLTARGAQKVLAKRGKQADLAKKHITPHVMRHSFATDLLNKGVDIRIVQEFLGHRSINSTQIYTHIVNSTLRDLHEKLYASNPHQ